MKIMHTKPTILQLGPQVRKGILYATLRQTIGLTFVFHGLTKTQISF